MKIKIIFAACIVALGTAARSDDLPEGLRWRNKDATFFFVNTGDTTAFYHAFVQAQNRWQPNNFQFSITGDASNNTPCQDRRPGIRIVNIAQFSPTACKGAFGPKDLAVTTVNVDQDNAMIRADIHFNSYRMWGVYDGPLNSRFDFLRVAAHELGHAAGLTHSSSTSSVMYPDITNTDRPSDVDRNRLSEKYATFLPPPSPAPPDDFTCPSHIPYAPVVDIGTLASTYYRLGECLDTNRPQTTFYFQLTSPRRVQLFLISDVTELNAEAFSSNTRVWSSQREGKLRKETTFDFPKGQHSLRISKDQKGATYRLEFNLL